jgi:hypothetical protein
MKLYRIMMMDELGTESCLENDISEADIDEKYEEYVKNANEEIRGIFVETQ